MTSPNDAKSEKPKLPRGKTGEKRIEPGLNPATAEEFESEGLGIAPKE